MKSAYLVRVAALFALIGAFGVSQAAAYHVYGAPCGDPGGLPGFLVKVHFIPKGTCASSKGGGCLNPGTGCSIQPLSGQPIPGTCQAQGSKGGGCACVAAQ
jgi:hypothetical protein